MSELILIIFLVAGWWIMNRPLNQEHVRYLKAVSSGDFVKMKMVEDLISSKNPKAWQSAALLHRFNMMRLKETFKN